MAIYYSELSFKLNHKTITQCYDSSTSSMTGYSDYCIRTIADANHMRGIQTFNYICQTMKVSHCHNDFIVQFYIYSLKKKNVYFDCILCFLSSGNPTQQETRQLMQTSKLH